ncbi:hypothetical protein SAMN04489761_0230 [Tenacibaculum sp. MAR_2009_124]|uniref:hypothetical protein n=1 Tax=Tenacibaculum sp. MAR_2009_124 TaxID=1250059 RepID=UPI00089930DC|nr:hypothetical protein [Tenacibaculum sp. MAR_2009_124]SEB37162.1 hypothetical protein SAMN04489761_0230 [Tenacibaculum sp. MAR_2009_124]
MKRIIILFALIFTSIASTLGQVKIGDNPNVINGSSVLELESSDKVLVITRVTDNQMNLIFPLEGAIVYNTDQDCIFQYGNMTWTSLCDQVGSRPLEFDTNTNILSLGDWGQVNLSSLIDDADNDPTNEIQILTFDNTTNTLNLVNGGSVNLGDVISDIETITTIVEGSNGTFTYTNESGAQTIIDVKNLETLTSLVLNNDNINIDYTDEDGVTNQLDLTNVVRNLETLTTIVEGSNGIFTYTDENGGLLILMLKT